MPRALWNTKQTWNQTETASDLIVAFALVVAPREWAELLISTIPHVFMNLAEWQLLHNKLLPREEVSVLQRGAERSACKSEEVETIPHTRKKKPSGRRARDGARDGARGSGAADTHHRICNDPRIVYVTKLDERVPLGAARLLGPRQPKSLHLNGTSSRRPHNPMGRSVSSHGASLHGRCACGWRASHRRTE